MKSSLSLAAALAVCVIVVGCGDPNKERSTDPPPVIKIGGPAPPSAIDEKEAQEFALAYLRPFLNPNSKQCPKKIEELDEDKDKFPNLRARIQDGSFVVIWNAALSQDLKYNKNDEFIIAHEKAAPERGGLVIFGGGTIDVVSAEEFKKHKLATPAK